MLALIIKASNSRTCLILSYSVLVGVLSSPFWLCNNVGGLQSRVRLFPDKGIARIQFHTFLLTSLGILTYQMYKDNDNPMSGGLLLCDLCGVLLES